MACCDVFAGRDHHGNPVCHPGCRIMTLAGLPEPLQHFDMLTRTKDGRTVWLDVSVLALPRASWMLGNGRENGDGMLHVFRDVTESKELLAVVRERFTPPLPADSSPVDGAAALTRREIEVLRLVAQGARTKAVAERLRLSPATVRNHVQNILGKLGAHNRLEAVAYATRHRLLWSSATRRLR